MAAMALVPSARNGPCFKEHPTMSAPVETTTLTAEAIPATELATPETPVEATAPDPSEIEGLGDAGKAAIDRMKAERNAANSERAALAAQLKEIQDRDLSALEKLTRDLDAAKAALAQREAASLRQEVALELGLPAGVVNRLQGSTKEELQADAKELLAMITVKLPASPPPDRAQGARPTSAQQAIDAEYEQFYPSKS